MHQSGQIRTLALALIRNGDRVLLSRGYDPVKQAEFYRALGGINFGESSADALQRELREELDVRLVDLHYLGCLESIFVFNNHPGHELIQLYRCNLADPEFYERDEIAFSEGERQKLARWVSIERCLSGELQVVPKQFLAYLSAPAQ